MYVNFFWFILLYFKNNRKYFPLKVKDKTIYKNIEF